MQKSVLQFVVLVAFYATLVLNAAVGVPLADQTSDKGAEISADFKGNGYLELNRSKIDSSQSLNSGGVAVLFSTENPNGLLFWHGQPKGETFNGTDFFSLAIINGIVELTVRLDNEQMVIKHRHYRVDNGERHVAFVKYSGNKASLELDGVTKHGETRLTDMGEMILPGHVFLGNYLNLLRFCCKI